MQITQTACTCLQCGLLLVRPAIAGVSLLVTHDHTEQQQPCLVKAGALWWGSGGPAIGAILFPAWSIELACSITTRCGALV